MVQQVEVSLCAIWKTKQLRYIGWTASESLRDERQYASVRQTPRWPTADELRSFEFFFVPEKKRK